MNGCVHKAFSANECETIYGLKAIRDECKLILLFFSDVD